MDSPAPGMLGSSAAVRESNTVNELTEFDP